MPFNKPSRRNFIAISEYVVDLKNYRLLLQCKGLLWVFLVSIFLSLPTSVLAQDSPPPLPSGISTIGQLVTNPITGNPTTVSALRIDPAGTPTPGAIAFVETADGYAFLVKPVGQKIYNNDPVPLGFTIVSQDAIAGTVQIDADPLDGLTGTLASGLTTLALQAQFFSNETPGVVTPPVQVQGIDGVRIIRTGAGGTNGRTGALFVPPSAGGNGAAGPTLVYENELNISASSKIGIEAGSIGGVGGKGGDSYLSFWDGRDGGDGGTGGNVTVTNQPGFQVAASGIDNYGIFAYSRSGQAGNGGSGFAAPGGGTGGHSSNAGNVTISNSGNVFTAARGAYGIYGLSVSNNGGNGGSQWGLVGQSGSGGFGGSGGRVDITNNTNGTVNTSGTFSHGILAQSIGGSGGSSGTSGNLLVSLLGSTDNGGNGSPVSVTNNGTIATTGDNSRGIMAQSLGGGGGTGGFAGGLIAVGGAGAGGGSADTVTIINNSLGVISTTGLKSDGIFAQSIGGSGGGGSNAGGLVAIGGTGNRAGNGGVVAIENYGQIATAKDGARGIVAQSIGGGGGDGGNSGGFVTVGGSGSGGGIASTVTIQQGGTITTGGGDATGILAQSIGGGGGNGGSSGSVSAFAGVAVGGTGSTGGNGAPVDVTLQGRDANTASLILTRGDRSSGLLAQSVGGGGGTGGGAVQVTGGFVGGASFAVGGQGGQGGQGGDVNLSKGAGVSLIETAGNDSTGLILQSVGGGGGNGGYAVSLAAAGGPVSGSLSVAIGGDGGSAGNGGPVTVGSFSNGTLLGTGFSGSILTKGERSSGFLAQSVGGGGGNGGLAVSAAAGGSAFFSGSIGIGLGGNGASAGDGGTVAVGTEGNITTEKATATGLLIQSVGGGGGNGGGAIAAGVGGGIGAGSIGLSIGGRGAIGGKGGAVTAATRTGSIQTGGDKSPAIVVQSIGGGGGNGGYSVSASGAGGNGAGAISIGLGGNGAGGGDGRNVRADLQSTVNTSGQKSTGILVQSVGGGGGSGGFNVSAALSNGIGSGAVSVGLGGSGAGGGNGARVDLTTTGNVRTRSQESAGIVAQSIGGGGGNGGFSVTAALSGGGTGSGSVSVGLGGSAGTGGSAAAVNSSVDGNITTQGDTSTGLLVQSVGGGGGNGGFSVSAALSGAGTGSASAAVGIGGSGGGGGDSLGNVTSSLRGNVTTTGKKSRGVIVQSLGGGGGNGGLTIAGAIAGAQTGSGAASVSVGGSGGGGGNSSAVDSTLIGNVSTVQEDSAGLLVQSTGGGGGNGSISVNGAISLAGTGSGAVSLGIGGAGGNGGNSASVTNRVTGTVTTVGQDSVGIAAQSVGGGGGNGGLNVTGNVSAAKTGSGALAIGIGGVGGNGGTADTVFNAVSGYIRTQGHKSAGILAQSVGGGGGNGGLNVTGTVTVAQTGSGNLAIGVGGFGGAGGDGNAVVNRFTGGTITAGDDSSGIVAQSLGGGGGNGGLNLTGAVNVTKENGGTVGIGIGGFGGKGGNASNVTSTVTARPVSSPVPLVIDPNQIHTSGDRSSAVVAQSLGGGGGNGGLNVTGTVNVTGKNGAAVGVGVGGFGDDAGNAGDVRLDVNGPIVTTGNDSNGLLAQSIGGGGGNGGINVTGAVAVTASTGGAAKAVAASIGVGGFGGNAGNSGKVDLTYSGNIFAVPTIAGAGSHGIAAQSIGGGGGNGRINVSTGFSFARPGGLGDGYGIVAGVGGFGGKGGNADTVNVNVSTNASGDSITASGDGKSGILAQSIGGGGGDGGINISGGLVSDSALIFGIGGFGADAGVAKAVTVKANTNVVASSSAQVPSPPSVLEKARNAIGDFVTPDPIPYIQSSAGILAQSLGGGGGNGGLNVSGGLAINKNGQVPSLTLGIGGFGGAGSTSGDVTVDQVGDITTTGIWMHGIMAQSIAGGGGNGAMNVSSQINWADSTNSGGKTDLTIVAGIGGNGGKGADAGNVVVTHNGTVTTIGDESRGIVAQSIGGGGGTGGMNMTGVIAKASSPISIGVGGSGSGGGNAGAATINRGSAAQAAGKVSTTGEGAHAIEASSIGGGGGDAGMNLLMGLSLAGNNPAGRFAAQLAIGGAGGEAGNGGTAKVTNYSAIETKKDNSYGLMAQSIGGGGGNANLNIGLMIAKDTETQKTMGFNLAIGGGPGDAGSGARADVLHVGNIETFGTNSFGILSQSIGGGGGNASLDVVLSAFNKGGGLDLTIGRRGGIGGLGADVTLDSTGTVITHGSGAFGLLAQSLGNGGGNSSVTSIAASTQETKNQPADAFALAVGLEGGVGGRGGQVILNAQGGVRTKGEKAHGIFAQSIGGGGGNGGTANTFSYIGNAPTAALSIGGTGGTGGIGGSVKVTSKAIVETAGASSVGILAQSIGGGGGNGGMARSGGLKSATNGVNVSVGGSGGSGMSSSSVIVENQNQIYTNGEGSHGVLAQSLGGGGGNAGMTINTLLYESADVNRFAVSIGGSGGDGSRSGPVNVTNNGVIGTFGNNAVGIFAQSIGGGGGNSDLVITGSLFGNGGGNSFFAGIGGTGGTGGIGAAVNVTNQKKASGNPAIILTRGDASHGILAMSIGGGGGAGSTTATIKKVSTSASAANAKAVQFSLGGAGGTGGTGGLVNVTNDSEIITYGTKAHGITAASIGGGGGNGGMAITGDLSLNIPAAPTGQVGTFAIGGTGGDGNKGGNVTVNNAGNIEVSGNESYGIYAQSIGGGGGDGSMAIALSRNLITNPVTNISGTFSNIAIGGFGGTGADSGNVLVQHSGSITARGDNSYGILAQSVAGGGGNIAKYSITNPVWMAANFGLATLLGGEGSAGSAGTATIETTGDITMLGKNSIGQLAQSVNGGGGNANLLLDFSQQAVELGADGAPKPIANPGLFERAIALVKSTATLGANKVTGAFGGKTESSHTGNVQTKSENSPGAVTQSIGGGGGNTTSEVVLESNSSAELGVTLGAKDTNDSSGGDITLNRVGDVSTQGNQSQGAAIQSIGGGGGRLLLNVKTISADNETVAGSSNSTAKVVLGNDPSFNNNGGAVNSNIIGNTVTNGNYSPGLVIQSIGAGGGQSYLLGLKSAAVTLGAADGSTGNGGDLQVTNTGTIATTGKLSDGIVLQSIGGGGGYVITDLNPTAITRTLSANNAGNGGNIQFTQTGDVVVAGERSIGILAQSLGGGGGVIDRQFLDTAGGAGSSGAIALALQGNVQAANTDSVGVLAQSRSSTAPGNIAMDLMAGKQINVSDRGVAVQFSGGANNTFMNHGSVLAASTTGLPSGYAFQGDAGNENIVNQSGATFVGNINLGVGVNALTNEPNATAITGREAFIGNGTFLNRGLISPGGSAIETTQITGNYTQAATGQFDVDLDLGNDTLDRLNITQQASLDGLLNVTLGDTALIKPGKRNLIFAAAAGGITQQDLDLNLAQSAVAKFSIGSTANLAFLAADVDFSSFGQLNPNQTAIGQYVNRIQAAGSSPQLAPLIEGLFNLTSSDQLAPIYDRLSPEIYGSIQSNLHLTTQRFMNNLFTCQDRAGTNRVIVKGKCVWFEGSTQRYKSDRTADYFGFNAAIPAVSAGVQFDLGKDWSLALAAGNSSTYETDFSDNVSAQIQGFSNQFGLSLKKVMGSTKIAAGLVGGYGEFNAVRRNIPAFNTTASSHQNTSLFGAQLRISHDFEHAQWYVRPMLDVSLSQAKYEGFRETGAGALNLIVAGDRQTNPAISPSLEVGGEIRSGQVLIRPRVAIGYTRYLANPAPAVSAQFEGAPANVQPFDVASLADRDYFDMSVDVNLLFQNGFSATLGYWGQRSQHTGSNVGFLKLLYSF